MEYTTLGGTGMTVSRIALGCMSFGSSDWNDWVLEDDASREIIERAIDLGVNFFDTANTYSKGESERIVGEVLGEYDRDDQVVASKVYFDMDPANPNASGLSRKAIQQEHRKSLDRLGMDTIDLYQIHRWDYHTPIEETLRTLNGLIDDGSVRYIGASSMWAHQFADAQHTAADLGLERFATMQNQYSLAYREEEREMLPYCHEHDVGVIPWSPFAKGYLTRPHEDIKATPRGKSDSLLHSRPYDSPANRRVNERVQELAAENGVTMAQISLAWLLHQDWVDAPIVGTTSVEHLEEAVEALDIDLADSDLEYLEEPYEPMPITGHT